MSTTIERPPAAEPGPESPQPEPMHLSRRRRTMAIVIGLLVLVAALFLGIRPRLARRKAVEKVVAQNTGVPVVRVTTVDISPGVPTVTLPGTIAPNATTPIYARAPGYIAELRVDIGSRVRRGDLLARISAPELDHQVQQASAMVAQDRANVALARVELARWIQMMQADSAVTQEEVDMKRNAYDVAVATLNAQIATWRQLAQLQSYERVVAPFDGVITARNIDVGALVGTAGAVNGALVPAQGSATGSLFELRQVNPLRIYVTVPEDNAVGVAVGQAALVTLPSLPGDTLHGRVVRTSNSLDPAVRTLLAEVDIPNPRNEYLTGSYAAVQLTLSRRRTTIRLPSTGLVIVNGPPQAVVLRGDSTVQFRTLTLGRDYGSWVEVTDGLSSGDRVVLNPPDLLKSGQRVRVMSGVPSPAN